MQLTLESDVKVDQLILKDVGQSLGIGNDALNELFIVSETHVTDDRRKGVSEQLNYLFGGVLVVGNEYVVTLPFLRTSQNQVLGTAVPNANRMHARIFIVLTHHSYDSLSV